jgi:hypothetical protein
MERNKNAYYSFVLVKPSKNVDYKENRVINEAKVKKLWYLLSNLERERREGKSEIAL